MVYRRTLPEAPCGLYEVNRLQDSGVAWMERRVVREVLGETRVEALLLENLVDKTMETLPADILIRAIGEEPTPPFQRELGLDNVTGPTKIGKGIYSALRTTKSLHH
jgi:glutamate synthase (NADPH/NADH) small chain